MAKKRGDGKRKRPTADELDECVAIPLDPAVVIEGMMRVDAEKVREAEPKRDRERKP